MDCSHHAGLGRRHDGAHLGGGYMTEPLIDRDALLNAIYCNSSVREDDVDDVTDAVLAYLRSVLTPDVLYQAGWVYDNGAYAQITGTGDDG